MKVQLEKEIQGHTENLNRLITSPDQYEQEIRNLRKIIKAKKLELAEFDSKALEGAISAIDNKSLLSGEVKEEVKGELNVSEEEKSIEKEGEEIQQELEKAGENEEEIEIKKELDPILEVLCPENENFNEYKENVLNELFSDAEKIKTAHEKRYQDMPNQRVMYEDTKKHVSFTKNILVSKLTNAINDLGKRLPSNMSIEDNCLKDEVVRSAAALLISGKGLPSVCDRHSMMMNLKERYNNRIHKSIQKRVFEHNSEELKIILDNLHKAYKKGPKEELPWGTLPRISTGFNYSEKVVEEIFRGKMPYNVFSGSGYLSQFEKSDLYKNLIPELHYNRAVLERLNRSYNDTFFREEDVNDGFEMSKIQEISSNVNNEYERRNFLNQMSDEDVIKVSNFVKERQKQEFWHLDNHSREILFEILNENDFNYLLNDKGVNLNYIQPKYIPLDRKEEIKKYFTELWKDNITQLNFRDEYGNSTYDENMKTVLSCFTQSDFESFFKNKIDIETDLMDPKMLTGLLASQSIDLTARQNLKLILESNLKKGLSRNYFSSNWAISSVNAELIRTGSFPKEILELPKVKESAFQMLKKSFNTKKLSGPIEILTLIPLDKKNLHSQEIKDLCIESIEKDELRLESGGNNLFENLKRHFSEIQKISQYIEIPQYFFQQEEVVNLIENLESQEIKDIQNEYTKIILDSKEPIRLHEVCLQLINEIKNKKEIKSDKGLLLAYISRFKDGGTQNEKDTFFEEIDQRVKSLSENQPADFSQERGYYKYVLKQVYPERNYDTYKNLYQYEDRTKDLKKYKFDHDGYEIKIDGVLGYKIKEGATLDQQIISDFSKRVEDIKDISNMENLLGFLNKEIIESKAEMLEGKILEYFNQKGYSLDTMNILLAYQLQGQYDQFVAGSTDRVSGAEDQTSKNYILLDELANRYGDSMKETIKAVQEAVANSSDKELFANNVIGEHGETYQSLAQSILDGLNKIPSDKITDKTIQMNILKAVKNTFQGVQNLQERAKYFSELFSKNDIENFSEVWKKHTDQLFVVSDAYAIDMKKIQALQSSVYQTIQNEIGKYEEIREVDPDRKGEVKGSKERLIRGYFSKNKENAHARMVGDVCLADDPNMLKNENYFEFVMFDQEKQKCVGTTMLLEMQEPDEKKYLLYCPNPSVGLVSEVSAKKLYQTITNRIKAFAEENGFDGVLVDKTHGKSTNRAGLFQNSLDQSCLKDPKGSDIVVNLKESHTLGGGYTYKDKLQIVWKK